MISRDLDLVAFLAADRAGLALEPDKGHLVENRLAAVARREGFASVHDLISAIRDRDDDRLIWAAVEALWPAETSFFRDPETFELIAEKVLPQLSGRGEAGPLRLWAAACGAGQEVFSLAMLLAEQVNPGRFDLLGSDLCERRLEKAQAGLYSQFEVQRGLSAHRLVRHFENAEDGFALSPRLRQTVRWRRVSLIDDISRLGQFDLVLCRHLAGVLTAPAAERMAANLAGAIAPGGYLVLGPEQSAPGLAPVPGLAGFHQRPMAERAAA